MLRRAPLETMPPESPHGPGEQLPLRLISKSAGGPPQRTRLERMKHFFLRLDVCWTALFFALLVVVAIIITSISRTQMQQPATSAWRDIHNSRMALFKKLLNIELEKAHSIASTLITANVERPLPVRSEKTLSVVCSTFVAFDTEVRLRAVLIVSATHKETVACIHGIASVGSRKTLTGYVSNNSIVKGTYYVDNTTYEFARPLVMATTWPESVWNISSSMSTSLMSRSGFRQSREYYDGVRDYVDPRTLWFYFARVPHLFYYNVPATLVARGFNLSATNTTSDFAQVRIDGSTLLPFTTYAPARGARLVILVNQSLNSSDPLIFCTNYGQRTVNDSSIYSANAAGAVTYLKVSEVADPLMRAALQHVDLKPLQAEGYTYTKEFRYRGALAIVTAYTLTSTRGLILPIVTVDAQRTVSPAYLSIMDVWLILVAAAVLATTALFWWFVRTSFSRPLERMTRRMLNNLTTGHRTLFYSPGQTVCTQLSEMQELIQAYDATVRQLRVIDNFIPTQLRCHMQANTGAEGDGDGVRDSVNRGSFDDASQEGEQLVEQLLTIVSIAIRPPPVAQAAQSTIAAPQECVKAPRRGQRLVVAVDSAAHAAPRVNSGPFASPADLEKFLSKVEEICAACDGIVHRFSPDSCVVHFGMTTRAHLLRKRDKALAGAASAPLSTDAALALCEEERENTAAQACAAVDAHNALHFTFTLQGWLQKHHSVASPRVTMVVDTSTFTCGHYRPRGSEQITSVAFGRDIQRALGHLPDKISVSIALTEETASLVRAEQHTDAGVGAVRQIPIESLHLGRCGLDADVVILYEALAGPVGGDQAWQRYQWCCFRAFSFMIRGHYAAALSAYKEVADISDLEPGLMPSSLRREAASSTVVGGAVSVQVQRLMSECERRVRASDIRPFCRNRCDPLGMDAVLQGVSTVGDVSPVTRRHLADPVLEDALNGIRATCGLQFSLHYPKPNERYVVEASTGSERARAVVASPPEWVQDSLKLYWRVAKSRSPCPEAAAWIADHVCIGTAGALTTLGLLALRDVPRPVANAIRNAPLGPMSDALRSATPVFDATPEQKAALRTLHKRQCELQHPNLLVPLSYSFATEGSVALLWEFAPGGTLRQVLARYTCIKSITAARFMHGVLSALVYLHKRGLAHGALHAGNVVVGANGVCRLHGHYASRTLAQKLFILPRSCHVSPAMAAGAMPTLACDVFCYGLMCIEVLCRAQAWRWASVTDVELQRTEEELRALMKAAEQPFLDAVVDGRIVANTAALEALVAANETDAAAYNMVRACLSHDPAARPTVQRMLDFTYNALVFYKVTARDVAE